MNFKIGEKEILKEIEKDNVEKIVLARNAPVEIKNRITEAAGKKSIELEVNGDEIQLAMSIGKPFPVSSVAYCRK